MSVWAVEECDSGPGVTVAIYDNLAAAMNHVASWDPMVLDHGSRMLRAVQWSVQSEHRTPEVAKCGAEIAPLPRDDKPERHVCALPAGHPYVRHDPRNWHVCKCGTAFAAVNP